MVLALPTLASLASCLVPTLVGVAFSASAFIVKLGQTCLCIRLAFQFRSWLEGVVSYFLGYLLIFLLLGQCSLLVLQLELLCIVGHYPLLPRAVAGPILQARAPHGAVPNHMTDGGFEPEPSAPVTSQHTAALPTWVVQRYAETLLELRAWV